MNQPPLGQPGPPRPRPQPGPPPQPPGRPRQPKPAPPQAAPISPQPQRDVDPRRPTFVSYALPVSTTETLPGRQIVAVVGVVLGVSTRPRDMSHHPEMAYINTAARQDAIGAMVAQAQEAGAHAVVGLRFGGGKISDAVTELTAYGTAVLLS